MANTYKLGSSTSEQNRLEMQEKLYSDRKYLELKKGINVCDVGCGSGANLWVAESIGDGFYTGIDIQIEQVNAAEKKSNLLGLKNTKFLCSDATILPVNSDWADLTFCRLVLVHNPNPLNILKEMYRVTKKTGKIVAIEPNNLSYIAFNKPYLNKCYHARVNYIYRKNKGTLDICPQLFHLFNSLNLDEITIKQHPIYFDTRNKEEIKCLYQNWIEMMNPVKEELFKNNIITKKDYELACIEADNINVGDSIYQSLWIASGIKS